MLNIPIRNKSREMLRIMMEPSTQAYDVPSGEEVVVSGDFKGVEIEVWDDNFISLWVSSEVTVLLAGEKMEPLKEV